MFDDPYSTWRIHTFIQLNILYKTTIDLLSFVSSSSSATMLCALRLVFGYESPLFTSTKGCRCRDQILSFIPLSLPPDPTLWVWVEATSLLLQPQTSVVLAISTYV